MLLWSTVSLGGSFRRALPLKHFEVKGIACVCVHDTFCVFFVPTDFGPVAPSAKQTPNTAKTRFKIRRKDQRGLGVLSFQILSLLSIVFPREKEKGDGV